MQQEHSCSTAVHLLIHSTMSKQQSLALYVVLFIVSMFAGGIILEATITGVMILVSFIVVIQGSSVVRWIAAHSWYLLDICIFVVALYAKFHFGVTIAMAFTYAGLGYSLLYAPYLKTVYNLDKSNK